MATITVRVTNNKGDGIDGEKVSIFTSLGVLDSCGVSNGNPVSGVQACTETTVHDETGDLSTRDTAATGDEVEDSGYVRVLLKSSGARPGIATVTFTLGELTHTVDVTLFGDAKSITAEADQSSIAIGGSTFIVVTVLDGAENPVSGAGPTCSADPAASRVRPTVRLR